jgi:Raf kinase inhibitor-like YbhB/YbcL family protein
MTISSSAFRSGQPIPVKYTCEGDDVSPPLEWRDLPAGAKSLSLIRDDPEAPVGTWVHWMVYDLPLTTGVLTEKLPTSGQ